MKRLVALIVFGIAALGGLPAIGGGVADATTASWAWPGQKFLVDTGGDTSNSCSVGVPGTDADGWLPTGDVGTVDARGIVRVTDSKKEIIITAGGKNIAPTKIESLLRAHPLIGQAVAIGDRRRYLTALLVLDEEAAPHWARANGVATTDLDELATDARVLAAIDTAVEETNTVLSRVEQIKRYRVLAGPWTAETGELTPKLSLRRRAIDDLHAATIESMYEPAAPADGDKE